MSEDKEYTYEFYPHRSLTKTTFERYGVRTKLDATGKPVAVGFPYSKDMGASLLKSREFDVKNFKWIGQHKAGLFGKEAFAAGSNKFVTITEGEYDALSINQVIGIPAVSVQSSSSALRDCSADRDYLNSFERIYLAFDNDGPGREAVQKCARLFSRDKVYYVKFSNRKDANEYLQAGDSGVTELNNLFWNSKKYVPDNVVSSLQDFKAILQGTSEQGISYPWPTLTKMTYGLRRGECVLFIAQEKVGKTSLMHEILHHILKETDDAVGAFFLEEPKKRLLQSLAGIEIQKPAHLPDSGVSSTEAYNAVEGLLQKDERLFIFDWFGSGDPDILLDSIRYLVSACGCGYILLDHLTMAIPGLAGESDERRQLDYLSTKLEMLVKELHFALLMVSHVNDGGQTRGSRWPTKVADITVRLERDLEHIDPVERNIIHLSVPYNRFCSSTGPAGDLLFDPATYTHTEVSHAA